MKSPWTLLCCVVLAAPLTACKSSAPAPTEGDSETEAPAAADESAKPQTTPAEKPDISAPPDVAAVPEDAEKSKSGLASRVLQKGSGKEHPTATSTLTVNYSGWTTDGKLFISSIIQGKPVTFRLNDPIVIPGWTEGLQLMVVGEKRRIWIPENLAYGGGPEAPQGMLVFDFELLDIK